MELTEAREILEDIGLADAITPDLQVATEVVLARVDELENVVSAYRKAVDAGKVANPNPDTVPMNLAPVNLAPARDPLMPEGFQEGCSCNQCTAYRNIRPTFEVESPAHLAPVHETTPMPTPAPWEPTVEEAWRYAEPTIGGDLE